MRTITAAEITQAIKELAMAAAVDLEPDILDALLAARDSEEAGLAQDALEMLVMNADIASRDRIPLCQDTGIGIVFLAIGQEVHITGALNEAVQEGVKQGYADGFLRKSVCDVLTRKNSGTNIPAVVHLELVAGEHVRITFLPKGCGSENMSALAMLPPSAGLDGVVDFVVQRVVDAGPNPCPPLIIGVGLGGSFEKAAFLAKKALLRPVGQAHARPDAAELEQKILGRINDQGGGVHGFGGRHTALAVHLEIHPSHIASLPVGVNIQCHSHRYKTKEL